MKRRLTTLAAALAAVAVISAMVATPVAAERPGRPEKPSPPPSIEELLDERADPRAREVVGGEVETGGGDARGTVVVFLEPDGELLDSLELGESVTLPILAAAPVDRRGNYSVRVRPGHPLLDGHESRQLRLVYQGNAGSGQSIVEIETTGRGRGMRAAEPHRMDLTHNGDGQVLGRSDVQPPGRTTGPGSENPPRAHNEDLTDDPLVGDAVEPQELSCTQNFVADWGLKQTSVIHVGSNTKWIRYTPKFTAGSKIKTGWAASAGIGEGFSIRGSGRHTTTATSGISVTWAGSNSYGSWYYDVPTRWKEFHAVCINYSYPPAVILDQYEVKATAVAAGSYPRRAGGTKYNYYCNPVAPTTSVNVTRGDVTTWNNGVKIKASAGVGGSINFDLASDRQVSSANATTFTNIGSSTKFICGRYDYPTTEGYFGYIIADWQDRGSGCGCYW